MSNLSAAEIERLAIIAEECGEVTQIVGKILRHGFNSYSPFDPKKVGNNVKLEKELGDILFIMNMCHEKGDIDMERIKYYAKEKSNRVNKYLHHN